MEPEMKKKRKKEQWLFSIPIIVYSICLIVINPMPEWIKYAFLAYLCLGAIYFRLLYRYLHKSNSDNSPEERSA